MSNYAQARTNMVDCQIHTNGVIDPRILTIFETLPREEFLPKEIQSIAYKDEDVTLGNGRLLLEPQVHARMVQLVDPKAEDFVLVIGDSCGYAAAVFANMVGTVFTLEDEDATNQIDKKLQSLDINNVVTIGGDLTKGDTSKAPFDVIFINGAVASVPEILLNQLSEGGRLVTVIKDAGETMGRVTVFEKASGGSCSSYPHFSAGCAYLAGFEPKTQFSF